MVTGCSLRHFLLLGCAKQRFPWMAACVLYFACPRLHNNDFLSNLRSVQVHFAIQQGSFVSNRGAKELQS